MSLSTSLSIATQSLFNATAEVENAHNNIANAQTPGYTREVVNLQSVSAGSSGAPQAGGGAMVQGFQSVRDELLQGQIQSESESQGNANAQLSAMQHVEPLFTTSTQDIGTEMTALFTSLSNLSTNPENSTARQGVLSAAQNLASAFNSVSNSLTQQQTGLNSQVSQDVSQINDLASQIAALNPQIAAMTAQGKDPGALQDKRDQLVLNLSNLTNVSVTRTESGITLTTGNGTPLVLGSKAIPLQTQTGTDGLLHVMDSNGSDITSTITGGDLGGTIAARDTNIPQLLNGLDALASQLGSAFNQVQAQGYDLNGKAGAALFSLPTSVKGAAAGIKVAVSDPSLIAASSDGSSGSGGNLQAFQALQTTALPSGQAPTDAYASLVYSAGSIVAQAQAASTASSSSLNQLNTQRNSVSGVSIDEESANLVQWQQSYEAAARVISTVQALFQVTMSMGTASAE
jgi:flagellar hook-associated protein 1 FlgK